MNNIAFVKQNNKKNIANSKAPAYISFGAMKKNIAEYLIEKTSGDIGLNDIAQATGVSDSFLSRLRSGKIKGAAIDFAIDLSLYFHEPLDVILKLLGKESYYPKLKRCMAREFQKDPVVQLNVPTGDFEGVKCFDSPVCLGPGYNMDEAQIIGYLPVHKSELTVGYASEPDRIVCFPTEGPSMAPTIMPDSHVVIDRYVPIEWVVPGGIYAFLLPNETVTIKRLVKFLDDSVLIDADNPDPKERCPGGATADFPMVLRFREDHSVVRGRVIWILNRLIEKPNS